jgi:hypothetical protein
MNKENQGQGNVSVGKKFIERFEKICKEEMLYFIHKIKDIPEDIDSSYHRGRRQGLWEGLESLKKLLIKMRGGNK